MGKNPAKDKGTAPGKSGKAGKGAGGTIALNKRARHEYHLEQRFEAGLALQITPLIQASTHVVADERRTRKLLLHRQEIDQLVGKVEREGYTLVPTALYWKGNKIKAELALARGKQSHDKRDAERERDWNREKQRVLRHHNRDA